MIPFCKDCRHMTRDSRCARSRIPGSTGFNPVTGESQSVHYHCVIERGEYGATDSCGPEGLHFEPKLSVAA
jgi:hypothetical protein